MIYGLWLSAAGLQANSHRQAVLANNLANAETTGFKQDLVVFRQRVVESQEAGGGLGLVHPVLDGLTGGTWAGPTYTDFGQGTVAPTGDPLDVAIVGKGFLSVETNGGVYYTRDGSLSMGADGGLVTVRGERVLDDAGAAIAVPPGSAVRIDEAGQVWADGAVVGRLGLVDFSDSDRLVKVGQNLFDGRFAERAAFGGRLQPGALEQSTVEPVELLARYIEASRAYEMNAELITLQDELLGRAVNDIGRT